MSPHLDGQIALVTGAGRGIGRSISLTLADAGAQVVVCARTVSQIEEVQHEIIEAGGKAVAIPADISDERDVNALFGNIDRTFNKLDIVVNNAGIGVFKNMVNFSMKEYDHLMSVNLRGTFLCCRKAVRTMIPNKKGYIINIVSAAGFRGYAGQSAYGASKHGIMGFTKALAIEAQEHNVRVSAILPGAVDTGLIPDARPDIAKADLIQPADIARTVLFLLSLSDHVAIDQIYIRRKNSAPF
jgi:NAD(P)-dependent dehydrogenase (short-subunit alcohol dehydrogenase family)